MNSKSQKRIIRDLQELRGCSYTAAMNELRGLPEGTNWKDYVMRVAAEPAPNEDEDGSPLDGDNDPDA